MITLAGLLERCENVRVEVLPTPDDLIEGDAPRDTLWLAMSSKDGDLHFALPLLCPVCGFAHRDETDLRYFRALFDGKHVVGSDMIDIPASFYESDLDDTDMLLAEFMKFVPSVNVLSDGADPSSPRVPVIALFLSDVQETLDQWTAEIMRQFDLEELTNDGHHHRIPLVVHPVSLLHARFSITREGLQNGNRPAAVDGFHDMDVDSSLFDLLGSDHQELRDIPAVTDFPEYAISLTSRPSQGIARLESQFILLKSSLGALPTATGEMLAEIVPAISEAVPGIDSDWSDPLCLDLKSVHVRVRGIQLCDRAFGVPDIVIYADLFSVRRRSEKSLAEIAKDLADAVAMNLLDCFFVPSDVQVHFEWRRLSASDDHNTLLDDKYYQTAREKLGWID